MDSAMCTYISNLHWILTHSLLQMPEGILSQARHVPAGTTLWGTACASRHTKINVQYSYDC